MRRRLLVIAWVLVAVGLGWWVVDVTALEGDVRADSSGYGQFVLAAVGLLIMIGDLGLRALAPAPRPHVDELAEQLALAVRAQWQQAAAERGLLHHAQLPIRWRRSRQPVAGPPSAATAPRSVGTSFAPLPGLEPVTAAQLREGTQRTLHRVYGALPSGRLIITGDPGSGKSSAAVLLLLDALRHREQVPAEVRAQVPVPVLFTLRGWDPETTPVTQWLVTKLVEFPTLTGRDGRQRAADLLGAGRVAVILDGLDEIPRERRVTALRALGAQATFRLVLLTRTAELVDAAEQDILAGAVALELAPLTKRDAARYLKHSLPDPAPEPWRPLLEALDQGSDTPVVRALDNPLLVTLLRDVYGPTGGAVGEVLDTDRFPTREDITDHLLDLAVTAAYTPRPGKPAPRYDVDTARHTLTVVAKMLQALQTRDLAWWDIPGLIPRKARTTFVTAASGVAGSVTGALTGALVGLFTLGLAKGWSIGMATGLIAGAGTGLLFGRWDSDWPARFGRFTWSQARWGWNLGNGLVVGALVAITTGLRLEPVPSVLAGLAVALVIGLYGGVTRALRSVDVSQAARPGDLWRGDLVHWLAQGLLLTATSAAGLGFGFGFAETAVVAAPLGVVLGFTVSRAWIAGVCQVLLGRWLRIPWRLGRFLEDAHERHVLRTVGPVYQFRHATLQDRLAAHLDQPEPAGKPIAQPDHGG